MVGLFDKVQAIGDVLFHSSLLLTEEFGYLGVFRLADLTKGRLGG